MQQLYTIYAPLEEKPSLLQYVLASLQYFRYPRETVFFSSGH